MSTSSPYAFNKINKLKLMKDLKYGKVHLRQSLIQMVQFQDIDKLYKNKKNSYSIQDQEINLKVEKVQENEQQSNILISPVDRIQQYRKEKLNKRLKQKMVKQFQQKKVQYTKIRVPKTMKMLQKFQDKYKNQMPISYKQRLRQSQANLQKIKRNDKSRLQVKNTPHKTLYQSRAHSNGRITSSQVSYSSPYSKKRFMSLKTSLPQKQRFVYPSLRQIMQGKLKENTKGPLIDLRSIENTLDNYVNHTIKKIRVTIQKQKQIDPRNSSLNSPIRVKSQAVTNRPNSRNKTRSNAELSIDRSEQSSKHMIETMSSFYQTKKQKKQLFDKMHVHLKYDRPLTSSIRRKHYLVPGQKGILSIDKYRQYSEQQRNCLREKNHQFYCKLIDGLEIYHEDDIPTTVFLTEQLKRVFETQYAITVQIFKQIIECVNKMKMDSKTEQILNQIASFMGLNLVFTSYQPQKRKITQN